MASKKNVVLKGRLLAFNCDVKWSQIMCESIEITVLPQYYGAVIFLTKN